MKIMTMILNEYYRYFYTRVIYILGMCSLICTYTNKLMLILHVQTMHTLKLSKRIYLQKTYLKHTYTMYRVHTQNFQ